jgi:hypothetical protein
VQGLVAVVADRTDHSHHIGHILFDHIHHIGRIHQLDYIRRIDLGRPGQEPPEELEQLVIEVVTPLQVKPVVEEEPFWVELEQQSAEAFWEPRQLRETLVALGPSLVAASEAAFPFWVALGVASSAGRAQAPVLEQREVLPSLQELKQQILTWGTLQEPTWALQVPLGDLRLETLAESAPQRQLSVSLLRYRDTSLWDLRVEVEGVVAVVVLLSLMKPVEVPETMRVLAFLMLPVVQEARLPFLEALEVL